MYVLSKLVCVGASFSNTFAQFLALPSSGLQVASSMHLGKVLAHNFLAFSANGSNPIPPYLEWHETVSSKIEAAFGFPHKY
ncbi:hypothetical protein DSO57_1024659, partial [Entomophthora muscae]